MKPEILHLERTFEGRSIRYNIVTVAGIDFCYDEELGWESGYNDRYDFAGLLEQHELDTVTATAGDDDDLYEALLITGAEAKLLAFTEGGIKRFE